MIQRYIISIIKRTVQTFINVPIGFVEIMLRFTYEPLMGSKEVTTSLNLHIIRLILLSKYNQTMKISREARIDRFACLCEHTGLPEIAFNFKSNQNSPGLLRFLPTNF